LTINDALIEIKSIQIESHSANTKGSKPDAHNGPSGEEEVK